MNLEKLSCSNNKALKNKAIPQVLNSVTLVLPIVQTKIKDDLIKSEVKSDRTKF